MIKSKDNIIKADLSIQEIIKKLKLLSDIDKEKLLWVSKEVQNYK